jgi:hypothetical protein
MVDTREGRPGALCSYLGAALCIVSLFGMFFIWLVPVIVRARTRSDFAREHAVAAADYGLTFLLALFGGGMVVVLLSTAGQVDFVVIFYLALLAYLAAGLIGLLIGAVRAWRGEGPGFIRSISLDALS